MITLTRNQVRRLRRSSAARSWASPTRGPIPPLVLRAEGGQLRAQHRYRDLAVEHVEPGSYRPATSVAIPLDALADFEGSSDSPVVLEAAAPDRTVVRWDDRAIPQSREYDVTPVDRAGASPGAAGVLGVQPGRAARRPWPRRPRRASPTRPATPSTASSSRAAATRSSPPTAGNCWSARASVSPGRATC